MKQEPDSSILNSAKILWNYLKVDMPLEKADGILIFCSNDLRVAEYAASLYHQGYAPWICPSGGVGRLTYGLFQKPEAEAFADVLIKAGVPSDVIFREDRATNSAENVFYTRQLLIKHNLTYKNLIVLQKPYMERRTMATLTHHWPELKFMISSPPISFENYPFEGFSTSDLVHVLVGDFQRIILYAERGWQTPQPIPDEVMGAFNLLVSNGYTREFIDPAASPSIPPQ